MHELSNLGLVVGQDRRLLGDFSHSGYLGCLSALWSRILGLELLIEGYGCCVNAVYSAAGSGLEARSSRHRVQDQRAAGFRINGSWVADEVFEGFGSACGMSAFNFK